MTRSIEEALFAYEDERAGAKIRARRAAQREYDRLFRGEFDREMAPHKERLAGVIGEARSSGLRDKEIREGLGLSPYKWRTLAEEIGIGTDKPGRPAGKKNEEERF